MEVLILRILREEYKMRLPNFPLLKGSLIKWGIVGFITTGFDYILFLAFYKNLDSVYISNLLSGVLATSMNYFAHHRWTFGSSRAHSSSGPRYFLSLAFWWFLSTFLIKFLIDSGIKPEIAKITPTFLLLPLNYLILNKVVFKK